MNQKKLQIWLPLLLSVALIIGMFFGYKLRDNMGVYGPGFWGKSRKTTLQEILALVKTKYVDSVAVDSLGYFAIQNVLSQLDPHSVYIPAEQLQAVNEDLQGNFEGIGVEYDLLNDTVTVIGVVPDGPAARAGLQPADQLLVANDSVLSGRQSDNQRVRNIFRGPRGTEVKLQLLRNGQLKDMVVQRGTINVKTIDAAYMLEPGTAFIRINRFASTTYEEFMENLERLQKEGMKRLILDVRENGGGILDDAIQIADELIDGSKTIVYTEGKSSPRQTYTARRPGLFEEGKLVVLIDENSASASEVLTGALQDWDRATVIGRRSFGKGLVQEQFNLSDGSAVRLTVSRYFTPLGRSIQKPYQRGNVSAYREELHNRITNGELYQSDSVRKAGKAFKTRGGRILYDGGGISPDVFVAADSVAATVNNQQDSLLALLKLEAFRYYHRQKANFASITTPAQLVAASNIINDIWNRTVVAARTNGLLQTQLPAETEQQLRKQISLLLARLMWGRTGVYQVDNLSDTMVQQALQQLKG